MIVLDLTGKHPPSTWSTLGQSSHFRRRSSALTAVGTPSRHRLHLQRAFFPPHRNCPKISSRSSMYQPPEGISTYAARSTQSRLASRPARGIRSPVGALKQPTDASCQHRSVLRAIRAQNDAFSGLTSRAPETRQTPAATKVCDFEACLLIERWSQLSNLTTRLAWQRMPQQSPDHLGELARQAAGVVVLAVGGAKAADLFAQGGVAVGGQLGKHVVLDLVAQVAGHQIQQATSAQIR